MTSKTFLNQTGEKNMSNGKKILAGVVLGAVATVGAARAAVVNITPSVVRYYANQAQLDADVAAGGGLDAPKPANNGLAGIYEVRYRISTALSSADTTNGFTGLGAAYFVPNGNLPAHLAVNASQGSFSDLSLKSNTTFLGYRLSDPISGNVDSGSGSSTRNTPVWNISPAGSGVAIELPLLSPAGSYSAADGRRTVTQSTQIAPLTGAAGLPTAAIDVFYNYDGTGPAVLQPNAPSAAFGFTLIKNNDAQQGTFFPAGTAGQTLSFDPVAFTPGTIPEPTALGLLALGSVMGLRRRRA